MSKFIIFLSLAGVFFGNSVFAQNPSVTTQHRLRGIFKTPNSQIIPGLRLTFKNKDREVTDFTDINGEFDVQLPVGLFELTVSKEVSEKFIAYLKIAAQGVNPNFIEFTIETGSAACGLGSEKSCPKITQSAKTIYTAAAQAVRAKGEVVVSLKINPTGEVAAAQAISGHPLLRQSSVSSAKEFRFEPSASQTEREAKLIFVFLPEQTEKKTLNRFFNPYRIIVTGDLVILDTTNY